jgi:hypothetical protein
MTDSTSIPAAEEGLIAALEAFEGLEGVTVSREKEPTRVSEFIWLYEATSEREYETLGFLKFKEKVDLKLVVMVIKGSSEVGPSRSRAYELLEGLEEVVAADRSLAGAVIFSRIKALAPQPVELDGKQGFRILTTLEARAEI